MAELLLCADDFGQSPGIDRAIAELVEMGRLGAFSCLTNGPRWAKAGAGVAALRARALAGLHLNLTEGAPASPALARHWPRLPGLLRLIADAHLGRLPLDALAEEVDAQWAAFCRATDGPPDFLDGHQHVHHLPGIRDLVVDRAARAGTPLRSTGRTLGPGSGFKRAVIERTGGRVLEARARQVGVPVNDALLGVYGFEGDYGWRMRGWLARVPARGALLFCHPGCPPADEPVPGAPRAAGGSATAGPAKFAATSDPSDPSDTSDPIWPARVREHAYLRSDAFARDLDRAGVRLTRRWPAPG